MDSGVWKSHGFPVIDMTEGASKFMEDGTSIAHVDLDMAERIRRMFVKVFSTNYFRKHRTWPVLERKGDIRQDILKSIQTNSWLEDPRHHWTVDDFAGLSLDKTLEFDYYKEGYKRALVR